MESRGYSSLISVRHTPFLHLLNCLYLNWWVSSLWLFLFCPSSCLGAVSKLLGGGSAAAQGQHTTISFRDFFQLLPLYCIKAVHSPDVSSWKQTIRKITGCKMKETQKRKKSLERNNHGQKWQYLQAIIDRKYILLRAMLIQEKMDYAKSLSWSCLWSCSGMWSKVEEMCCHLSELRKKNR